MQIKTGRHLRLVACLAGVLGGLSQAMLTPCIYGTGTHVDAYIAAVMAISNFVVSLILIGHHSVHIYTPIKSSIAGLFVTGVLANLVGVGGLLLNENVNFQGCLTDHLLFMGSQRRDYAFAALFYISVCISCIYAAGLATYFLIDVDIHIYDKEKSDLAMKATLADPKMTVNPIQTNLTNNTPQNHDNGDPFRPTREVKRTDPLSSNFIHAECHDTASFCSAQSDQSNSGLSGASTEDTLLDEQQHQQAVVIIEQDRNIPEANTLSPTKHLESAETQALSVSPSRYHTAESQDTCKRKNSTRSRRSSKDQHSPKTILGEPQYSSTPLRSNISSRENASANFISPPPPPPPPVHAHRPTTEQKHRGHFRDIPNPSSSGHRTNKSAGAFHFRGLPNSLLNEVQAFDRSKFSKSPRRPSCAVVGDGQSSLLTDMIAGGSATITTDHSTQTSITSKPQ